MPIRKPLTQRFTSFVKGVDNTTNFVSSEINGTLSVGNNADLVNESLVSKRKGYKNFTSNAGRTFRQGLEYIQPSGKQSTILYHEANAFDLNSGVISEMNNAGVITDLLTGQKSNVQPSMVQFASRLFIYNGDTNYVYNGKKLTEVGMVAPDEAPVDAGAGTGGDLNPGGSYLYVYTYYNSATGDESSPSPPSESIVAPANGSVRLSLKAGNPDKANEIRLYRTVDGGADLFFDRSIPIDRTSVDSEIADVSLGKLLEPDGSTPPDAFTYAVSTDNRIFLVGPNNPGRVYWTKIGSEGAQAEVVQALDFADCNLNDGDKILGLGLVNNVVIIKKQNSVGRLVKIEANLSGAELAGSQKYIYEEISRDVTGLSHHCGVTLGNLYVWLGRDEIYATDGVRIIRLGDRIRNTLSSLNYIFAHKFTAIVKKDTKQIIWSVCTGAEAEPDFQIVGHYRYMPQQLAFTFYTPGLNKTTHPGLKATSFFTKKEGNLIKYYFGTSDGKIHQMASGDNDDTLGIAFDVRLPWSFGKDPINQKVFHSAYFHIFGNGNDYDVDLSYECDLEINNVTESITLSINEDPDFVWEAVNWEEFNWSFLSFDPVKLFPKRRAHYGRYGVQNDNANEPLAINAVTSIMQTYPIHR